MYGNVWCSTAWTWVSDEPMVTNQFFVAAGASTTPQVTSTLAAITASIVGGDYGLCCFENSAAYVTSLSSPSPNTQNSAICPGLYTNAGEATSGVTVGNMRYAVNYWCSNGTFQLAGTAATKPTNFAFGAAEDKFTEFMLVACRQTLAICGDAQVTIMTGTDLTRNVGSKAETCTSAACAVEATRK